MPGSGDMSEIAFGWSTYESDHMAMYDVNAGLPKTVIKRMIADIAACDLVSEKLKEALVNVLNAPISPELLPLDSKGEVSQNTEESIGSYGHHRAAEGIAHLRQADRPPGRAQPPPHQWVFRTQFAHAF